MRKSDEYSRFLIENSNVRGMVVHLDNTWLMARERMDYPAPVKQVLGEAFAATVLLSKTIKFEGKLTLQVRGDGPVHMLVVQVTRDGAVRGLARWSEVPEGQTLGQLFGSEARMTIGVEVDAGGVPHQGIVELVGESLSDALQNYFETSVQLQTRFYLAVGKDAAAGMLIQKLPKSEAQTDFDSDGWERAAQLANTLSDEELIELDTPEVLKRLYHEEEVRLYDGEPVAFKCSCSRDRTNGLIQGLGTIEAESILAEQGGISITCEFCAAEYTYDAVDVELLFRTSISGEHPNTLH